MLFQRKNSKWGSRNNLFSISARRVTSLQASFLLTRTVMFGQSAAAREAVSFSCDMERSVRLSIRSSCGDGPVGSARGPCSSLVPRVLASCLLEWVVCNVWTFKSNVANRHLSLVWAQCPLPRWRTRLWFCSHHSSVAPCVWRGALGVSHVSLFSS